MPARCRRLQAEGVGSQQAGPSAWQPRPAQSLAHWEGMSAQQGPGTSYGGAAWQQINRPQKAHAAVQAWDALQTQPAGQLLQVLCFPPERGSLASMPSASWTLVAAEQRGAIFRAFLHTWKRSWVLKGRRRGQRQRVYWRQASRQPSHCTGDSGILKTLTRPTGAPPERQRRDPETRGCGSPALARLPEASRASSATGARLAGSGA